MLRGVNRADDETDDEILAELMREGESRLASEQRARQGRRARVRGAGAAWPAVSAAQRAALRRVRGPVAGAVDPRVGAPQEEDEHAAPAAGAGRGVRATVYRVHHRSHAVSSGPRGQSERGRAGRRENPVAHYCGPRGHARAGPSSNVPARRRRRAEVGRHGATMREYCPRREAAHGCYGYEAFDPALAAGWAGILSVVVVDYNTLPGYVCTRSQLDKRPGRDHRVPVLSVPLPHLVRERAAPELVPKVGLAGTRRWWWLAVLMCGVTCLCHALRQPPLVLLRDPPAAEGAADRQQRRPARRMERRVQGGRARPPRAGGAARAGPVLPRLRRRCRLNAGRRFDNPGPDKPQDRAPASRWPRSHHSGVVDEHG
ncbi:hypothetical protein ON010_g7438 [Phytophthora cinnamomi]|nr:hypothetical protein ON010_g7438 [Phytophthora cinnamomi]